MASFTDHIAESTQTYHEVSTTDSLITPVKAEADVTTNMAEGILRTSSLLHVGKEVNKYLTPCIVALGYFGNITVVLTMNKVSMRRSSCSVYFTALALADLLVLTNHIMFNWVENSFPPDTHYWLKNDQLCKLRHFTLMYGLVWSGMTLVALTAERFVVTVFPFRGKILCTRRNATIVVISIALFFGVIWAALIWRFNPKWGPCTEEKLMEFLFEGGLWFTTAAYTYIPTPVLLTLNGILARHAVKARSRRKLLTNSVRLCTRHRGSSKHETGFTRLTITAMVVSVCYLVLTLPTTTVNIYGKMYLEQQRGGYSPDLLFAHNICLMLRLLNHSINFVLYFMSSAKLRSEFCNVLMCCRCRDSLSQSADSSHVEGIDGPVQNDRPNADDGALTPQTVSETVDMQNGHLGDLSVSRL